MNISGIGKLGRQRMTALLRNTQQTISVAEAAGILNIRQTAASRLLAHWTNKGWLSRIKQGVYIPVPLESATADITLEDPWIIAEKLYSPCYIGAWSAAEYWGLTEQIFRTIVVITTQKPRNRKPIIKGTNFLLHTTSQQAMFGLQSLWRNNVKVFISDPTRTVIDLLAEPKFSGGIRTTSDILKEYLKSPHKNLELLIKYAKQLDNSAVFKRLGFLLEQFAPQELAIIETCKSFVTISKAKLDPQLDADKFVTRWRLWVPENWKN